MKKVLVVLIIIVVYSGLLFTVSKKVNNKKEKNKNILDIPPSTEELKNISPGKYIIYGDRVLKYNNEWKDMGTYDSVVENKNIFYSTLFDIYINNSYKGKYYVYKGKEKWYYIDENEKISNFSGVMFAISSSLNCKLEDVNSREVLDEELSDINKQLNVSLKNKKEYKKYVYDFNGDGNQEKLYFISNISDHDVEDKYSYVLYDNSKMKKIFYSNYTNADRYKNKYVYVFNKILNIDSKKYVMINMYENGNSNIYTELIDLTAEKFSY